MRLINDIDEKTYNKLCRAKLEKLIIDIPSKLIYNVIKKNKFIKKLFINGMYKDFKEDIFNCLKYNETMIELRMLNLYNHTHNIQ